MNCTFDPESSNFTLEAIICFGFDQYAHQISDISTAANKELVIETVGCLDIV